jgi:16S rRNA A1518/A1519 N6-dimethyltransferase RsmA/KsgA/DIM1 with predicted DNA glycosylase/AP lyase activity
MPSPSLSALSRFDELAEAYEEWFLTRLGSLVDRREKELILSLVKPRPGQTVLEVGSGTGHFLREIAGRGARCVGIEPSARCSQSPRHRAIMAHRL